MTEVNTQERELIQSWRVHLEIAMHNATIADDNVVKHRKRLKRYCVRMNYSEHQTREKFKLDYDLGDALDDYRRWCSEVQRYSAMIQAFAATSHLNLALSALNT